MGDSINKLSLLIHATYFRKSKDSHKCKFCWSRSTFEQLFVSTKNSISSHMISIKNWAFASRFSYEESLIFFWHKNQVSTEFPSKFYKFPLSRYWVTPSCLNHIQSFRFSLNFYQKPSSWKKDSRWGGCHFQFLLWNTDSAIFLKNLIIMNYLDIETFNHQLLQAWYLLSLSLPGFSILWRNFDS